MMSTQIEIVSLGIIRTYLFCSYSLLLVHPHSMELKCSHTNISLGFSASAVMYNSTALIFVGGFVVSKNKAWNYYQRSNRMFIVKRE